MKRQTTCATCGKLRIVGGKTKEDSLCWDCFSKTRTKARYLCIAGCGSAVSGFGRRCHPCKGHQMRKGKPLPHQQFQSERREDRQAKAPSSSWWVVPRDQWGAAIEGQRARHQAGGCGVPKTQQGLSE